MARLPTPGGDNGGWGDILNDYLSQVHNSNGTLKDNIVTSNMLAPNSVGTTTIANGSITEVLLASAVQTKLNASGGASDWSTIANKPAVIAAGADQAAARTAIGAGTSNLAIGLTGSTAAAGNDTRLTDQRIPTDGSVTTAKIVDGNVTLPKLSSAVQTSLGKADTAVQTTLRPLSSSYRPLKGVTSAITSTLSTGETSSNTFYSWNGSAAHFRYVGCQPVAYADPIYGVNFNVGLDASSVANTIEIEFWSNATTIRSVFYNAGKYDVWAVVDDMRITDGTYQHANIGDGFATWELTQATAVWRKWRLCLPATTFKGIGINSGATMTPTAKGFQLAVIGDSYVAGGQNIANAISPGTSGVISTGATFGEMAQETGLDIWRIGVSGTGYVNDAGYGAGNGTYGSTSRMSAFASLPAMDAIVVWGSANDKPYSNAAIVAAAGSHWAALRTARPNTPIIVVGPECTGWADATLDSINNALRVAANANANVTAYVDLRNHNFMSGTGYDGSPQGDGNADVFISADAGHPTHMGDRYWGQNIARLLGTVMLPADNKNGSF